MIVFTVHEPPNPPVDRIERAEKLEFVRDGFSSFAAVLPPVWMAMNRLWLSLFLYLLIWLGADLALVAGGVDKSLIGLINMAANIIVGFEASTIRRWTLERRSWSEIGTVVGRNQAECERRFFDKWLQDQPLWRRQMPTDQPMHAFDVSPENQPMEAAANAPRPSRWRRLLGRRRATA